jgi:outer membrane protein OmpA-like peptidoglycan-associated protein
MSSFAFRFHFVLSRAVAGLTISALIAFSAACTTDPYTGERQVSRTAIGAGAGAAAGAAGGAAIGAIAGGGKGAWKGAAIGAGVGTLSGAAVGGYMDYQESKLRKELAGTGVSVTRVGDEIVLNMPGNVTFDTDRAEIRPDFYPVLNSVVKVLKEYDKTLIAVSGFTDSTGSDQHNLELSQRRADAVGGYLKGQGLNPARVQAQGFGEQQPIASNDTPSGRQENRRVELRLMPLTA